MKRVLKGKNIHMLIMAAALAAGLSIGSGVSGGTVALAEEAMGYFDEQGNWIEEPQTGMDEMAADVPSGESVGPAEETASEGAIEIMGEGAADQGADASEAVSYTHLESLKELVESSKDNTGLNFQIALNYGSRDEIVRAVRRISTDCMEGRIRPEEITESSFASYLDTAEVPDPDLLIRTSGEQRLSNYPVSYTHLDVYKRQTLRSW